MLKTSPSAEDRRSFLILILISLAISGMTALLRPSIVSLPEAIPPGNALIKATTDAFGRYEGVPISEGGPISPSKVKLNTSSREFLLACPGIGPSTADNIISERESAPFSSWNDLKARVPGMGPSKIASLQAAGVTIGP
ncbi:MAG: helix-hairpin-helix domain-containing protein [Candidatus Ozemobacteraceae bacterium]